MEGHSLKPMMGEQVCVKQKTVPNLSNTQAASHPSYNHIFTKGVLTFSFRLGEFLFRSKHSKLPDFSWGGVAGWVGRASLSITLAPATLPNIFGKLLLESSSVEWKSLDLTPDLIMASLPSSITAMQTNVGGFFCQFKPNCPGRHPADILNNMCHLPTNSAVVSPNPVVLKGSNLPPLISQSY